MIKKKLPHTGPIEIDLTGPEGNILVLLGILKGIARQMDIEWDPIQAKVLSQDYETSILYLDEIFGHVVTFLK